MVANVRSLSVLNISMLLSAAFFSVSSSARSEGDKLKKAISEPLAKPDANKRMAARNIDINTPVVGDDVVTSASASVINDRSTYLIFFSKSEFSERNFLVRCLLLWGNRLLSFCLVVL